MTRKSILNIPLLLFIIQLFLSKQLIFKQDKNQLDLYCGSYSPLKKLKFTEFYLGEDNFTTTPFSSSVCDGVGGYPFSSYFYSAYLCSSIANFAISNNFLQQKENLSRIFLNEVIQLSQEFSQEGKDQIMKQGQNEFVNQWNKLNYEINKNNKATLSLGLNSGSTLVHFQILRNEPNQNKLFIFQKGDSQLVIFRKHQILMEKQILGYIYKPVLLTLPLVDKQTSAPDSFVSFIDDPLQNKINNNDKYYSNIVNISKGDIIISGSDGIFDNLSINLLTMFLNFLIKEAVFKNNQNIQFNKDSLLTCLIQEIDKHVQFQYPHIITPFHIFPLPLPIPVPNRIKNIPNFFYYNQKNPFCINTNPSSQYQALIMLGTQRRNFNYQEQNSNDMNYRSCLQFPQIQSQIFVQQVVPTIQPVLLNQLQRPTIVPHQNNILSTNNKSLNNLKNQQILINNNQQGIKNQIPNNQLLRTQSIPVRFININFNQPTQIKQIPDPIGFSNNFQSNQLIQNYKHSYRLYTPLNKKAEFLNQIRKQAYQQGNEKPNNMLITPYNYLWRNTQNQKNNFFRILPKNNFSFANSLQILLQRCNIEQLIEPTTGQIEGQKYLESNIDENIILNKCINDNLFYSIMFSEKEIQDLRSEINSKLFSQQLLQMIERLTNHPLYPSPIWIREYKQKGRLPFAKADDKTIVVQYVDESQQEFEVDLKKYQKELKEEKISLMNYYATQLKYYKANTNLLELIEKLKKED